MHVGRTGFAIWLLWTCTILSDSTAFSKALGSETDFQRAEFFEKQIRPVLIEHCYECHSPTEKGVQGGLDLTHRDGLSRGGDSGSSIDLQNPANSLLLEALRYESYEMPPAGRLPDAVVADFERWIVEGAYDPRDAASIPAATATSEDGPHWAFEPPQASSPPGVANSEWPRTPIDNFVLARLESAGLEPAPPADRETFIRRLTYDLTGLPPSADQVRAFLADDSAESLSRVVEQLLASPRYGETWGRHWLDVARYADSNGGDFNATFYNAWRYRDYVIQSYADDKPFDVFVREQIAGDLLAAASDAERGEQLAATGFLALGPKMLSERDKEKLQMDIVDEQLDTIGKAFLGLTIGCARCHDHKFDPIPTREYYAMAGILGSTLAIDGEIQQYVSDVVEQPLPVPSDLQQAIAQHAEKLAALKDAVKQAKKQVEAAETTVMQSGPQPLLADDTEAVFTGSWKPSTHSPGFVGTGYRHDENANKGECTAQFQLTVADAGKYELQLSFVGSSGRAKSVPLTVLQGGAGREFVVNQTVPATIDDMFVSLGEIDLIPGEVQVTVSNKGTTGHVIVDAVRLINRTAAANVVDNERFEVAKAKLKLCQDQLAKAEKSLTAFEKQTAPKPPKTLSVIEATEIADCAIRIRGEPARRGDLVPRGFLSCCGEANLELPKDESGRRELAAWLTQPENPLVARVYVNRVWVHLMGEGLVRSVDYFGRAGESPTHPALLDDLAVRFVQRGWSTKWLIREIVLSQTYRQSTTGNEATTTADPDNRLLGRMNRRRLPAEAFRDSLLQLTGRLDESPTVDPVATLGKLAVSPKGDQIGSASAEIKRSVYMPLVRNELPPILTVFDFADSEAVMGQRPVTNVPAQALFLLNSPFMRESAAIVADRMMQTSADDAGGIEELYLEALSRRPRPEEIELGLAFLQSDNSSRDDAAGRKQRWTLYVQSLLASTELRTLE